MTIRDIFSVTLVISTVGLIIALVLNDEKLFGDLPDAEMAPLRVATMTASVLCLIMFRR